MAKCIHPRLLKTHLRNKGPYLYYFNYKKDEYNQILVRNMRKLASIYTDLDILELDLLKFQIFQKYNDIRDTNCVKLFTNGKLYLYKNYPDSDDLAELFIECIKLHNEKIQIQLDKVGSRPLKSTILKINDNFSNKNKLKMTYDQTIKYRKKRHMLRITSIPKKEDFKKYLIFNLFESSNDNCLIQNKCINKSLNLEIHNTQKLISLETKTTFKTNKSLFMPLNDINIPVSPGKSDKIFINNLTNDKSVCLKTECNKINLNKDYEFIKINNFCVSPETIDDYSFQEQPLDLSYKNI